MQAVVTVAQASASETRVGISHPRLVQHHCNICVPCAIAMHSVKHFVRLELPPSNTHTSRWYAELVQVALGEKTADSLALLDIGPVVIEDPDNVPPPRPLRRPRQQRALADAPGAALALEDGTVFDFESDLLALIEQDEAFEKRYMQRWVSLLGAPSGLWAQMYKCRRKPFEPFVAPTFVCAMALEAGESTVLYARFLPIGCRCASLGCPIHADTRCGY